MLRWVSKLHKTIINYFLAPTIHKSEGTPGLSHSPVDPLCPGLLMAVLCLHQTYGRTQLNTVSAVICSVVQISAVQYAFPNAVLNKAGVNGHLC